MNSADLTGRHRFGRYRVSSCVQNPEDLVLWIRRQRYLNAATPTALMNQYGRAKNRLFELLLAQDPHSVVMKVCSADPRYRWRRRLELFVRQWFRDYSLTAFRGCRALYQHGLPVAVPIAWWQHHDGLRLRQTYFLYRKIDADSSIGHLLASDQRRQVNPMIAHILTRRIARLIRDMHAAGWRHDDVHLHNLLISTPRQLDEDSARTMDIHLIDYDHCSRTCLRVPFIQRFLDLKCLAHVQIPYVSVNDTLAYYIGDWPAPFWRLVLSFWRNGGFSLARRHRKRRPRRPRGAHLKPQYRTNR